MKKIVEIAHDYLIDIDNHDVAIDFTCGNGNDTLFLSNHFNTVYAFDIQEIAINNTSKLCKDKSNIKYILDDHFNFNHYLSSFNAGIFNLGYLPHGDKTITTLKDNVVNTLKKVLDALNNHGRIVIVCYPGFIEGNIEAVSIEKYLSSLESKHYDVSKFKLINRHHAPFIMVVDKH